MKASELVAEFQELIRQHGDLDVITDEEKEVFLPEFNEDDEDEPVFVLPT